MTRYAARVEFLRAHLQSTTPWCWPMTQTYRWDRAMVHQLLSSMQSEFNLDYQPGHRTSAVSRYGEYGLGTVHVIQHGEQTVLLDGFQRLTTLLLIMIATARCAEAQDAVLYQNLTDWHRRGIAASSTAVFDTAHFGSFLQAVVDGNASCIEPWSRLGGNVKDRFLDIQAHPLLTAVSAADVLPVFAQWLLINVVWTEVTAIVPAELPFPVFEQLNRRGILLDQSKLESIMVRQRSISSGTAFREMVSTNDSTAST